MRQNENSDPRPCVYHIPILAQTRCHLCVMMQVKFQYVINRSSLKNSMYEKGREGESLSSLTH